MKLSLGSLDAQILLLSTKRAYWVAHPKSINHAWVVSWKLKFCSIILITSLEHEKWHLLIYATTKRIAIKTTWALSSLALNFFSTQVENCLVPSFYSPSKISPFTPASSFTPTCQPSTCVSLPLEFHPFVSFSLPSVFAKTSWHNILKQI